MGVMPTDGTVNCDLEGRRKRFYDSLGLFIGYEKAVFVIGVVRKTFEGRNQK